MKRKVKIPNIISNCGFPPPQGIELYILNSLYNYEITRVIFNYVSFIQSRIPWELKVLWEIIFISLIEMARPTYCGWACFLVRNPALQKMKTVGWAWEFWSLPDHGCDKLLLQWLPSHDGHWLRTVGHNGPFSLELLLSGHFITARGRETMTSSNRGKT